jgi:hypothetical protein
MDDKAAGNDISTRQEKREKKLRKKRERMQQHGKGFISIYRDAILKRLRGRGK